MDVSILGGGKVGSALGQTFSGAGHKTYIGARDLSAASKVPGASVISLNDAVDASDLVFVCVPGSAVLDVLSGVGSLQGKTVVDCTNPIKWDDGPVWTPPAEGSNAASIAIAHPECTVLKAFNTFGAEFHANPNAASQPANVYIAGDDDDAKKALASLVSGAGFLPVDSGPLRNAAVLENVAVLWIHLAMAGGQGREFVLNLVR